MAKCEHGRQRSVCKDCGGGSICDHQVVRSTCSICEPGQVFQRYRRSAAAERGIPFLLSESQFREIVIKPCQYCGDYGFPRGVDRVVNSQPYIAGNVVASCGTCNFWKKNHSQEFFLDHARKIVAHQESIKKKKAAELQVQSAA